MILYLVRATMDRKRIELESRYFCWESEEIKDCAVIFAEYIANISRQETLAEVKSALDRMQEGKK